MSMKLIYIYPGLSSFVRKDKSFFETQFQVSGLNFQVKKKCHTPWMLMKESFFLLTAIPSASIVVIQFGGYHSLIPAFLARLSHKPSVIVMGGTDCVSFPSIGYGNLRKPLLRWFTLKSFRLASMLIPASQSLVEYDYDYCDKDYPKQGYKYFDPGNKTPYKVIFNGISLNLFRPVEGIIREKNTFLTVCSNLDRRNYFIKGIDLFIEAAKRFPGYKFVLVGKTASGFEIEKPENLRHIPFVSHDDLPGLMSSCSFYCQLSLSEGFGVALTEAMACGCIPVVSKVGILDQIAGDSGFVLEKYDKDLLVKTIENAVNSDVVLLSERAGKRAAALFHDGRRFSELIKVISDLIEQNKRL